LNVSENQGGDGLFAMTPVEPPVVVRGPVNKTFRPFQPNQICFGPAAVG